MLNESGHGTSFVHLSVDFHSPLTPCDTLVTTVAFGGDHAAWQSA
jgi:hypothetical protein